MSVFDFFTKPFEEYEWMHWRKSINISKPFWSVLRKLENFGSVQRVPKELTKNMRRRIRGFSEEIWYTLKSSWKIFGLN